MVRFLPMKRKNEFDRLDWKILEALQADARCTNTEIGKRIGLSQPAVTARIQRLEGLGVIEGYTARINPKRIGAEMAALIGLNTSHSQIAACLKAFDAMSEVIEVHRITGTDCFMIKVVVYKMSRLEEVIDSLAKYGIVNTSIILTSYPAKPIRAPV